MKLIVGVPDLTVASELTSHGFVQPPSEALTQDVANHLAGDIMLRFVSDTTGADIGFATFAVDDDLLYLHGIMLDTEAQNHRLAERAIEHARLMSDTTYLALRTQSPRMWSVGHQLCSEWLPSDPLVTEHAELAAVLDRTKTMSGYRGDPIGLAYPVHVGCYNGPLYGEKPVHHDVGLQRWWDAICNFERGDGVVCVGRFKG